MPADDGQPKVLIVGAGPTGLTAAVELARRGIVADVIDRREEASGLSRAVGILPRSLDLLGPSGVADRLRAEGIAFESAKFYRNARFIARIPLTSPTGDTILGLAQDRTEHHLADVFRGLGGTVRYGLAFERLVRNGEDAVEAGLGDGSTAGYDYLIGADGVRSSVRETLGLAFEGYDLPEKWSIADVDVEAWENARDFTICLLDAGAVAVVAPLEARRVRVISNTPDALAALPIGLETRKVRRKGQFTISVRQVRDYARGRVFLAGDAAHCHSPVGGRGMNLGIADAADLAERIARGTTAGYTAARHAAGAGVIAGSESARKQITSKNPLSRPLIVAALRLVGAIPALQRRFSRQALGQTGD